MDTHLHHDHIESHLKSSDLLRDVVIGMSDGLTVPFALAAGLSGAVDQSSIIVIAGIAEVAAGSIAMGLGGYLAGKTEQDHYSSEVKREYDEVLPWDHIDCGVSKEFLISENEKAINGQTSNDCRDGCIGCNVNTDIARGLC